MYDEMDRLRESPHLLTLLRHYAELAGPDRQVWQDRLMQVEDCDGRAMTRLHGEMMAHGWLEQNTGLTPVLRAGEAAGCYRVTTVGLRALRQFSEQEEAVA